MATCAHAFHINIGWLGILNGINVLVVIVSLHNDKLEFSSVTNHNALIACFG